VPEKLNQQPLQPDSLHSLSALIPADKRTTEYQKMRERIDAVKAEMRKVSEDSNLTKAEKRGIIMSELMIELEKAQRFKRRREQGQEIIAQTLEGQEIVFNLEQIWEDSEVILEELNLKELAESIAEVKIKLTQDQIDLILSKTKEGFNKFYLLPSIELQQEYLIKIREEAGKPMYGLKKGQQYEEKFYVDPRNEFEPNFPDKIATLNRPENKCYFLFIKDTLEASEETLGRKFDVLRELFQKRKESGLTLFEYLLWQRDYIRRHKNEEKPHPDSRLMNIWLLDSELAKNSSEPGRILYTHWNYDHIEIEAPSMYINPHTYFKSRSSVVFEILWILEKHWTP